MRDIGRMRKAVKQSNYQSLRSIRSITRRTNHEKVRVDLRSHQYFSAVDFAVLVWRWRTLYSSVVNITTGYTVQYCQRSTTTRSRRICISTLQQRPKTKDRLTRMYVCASVSSIVNAHHASSHLPSSKARATTTQCKTTSDQLYVSLSTL